MNVWFQHNGNDSALAELSRQRVSDGAGGETEHHAHKNGSVQYKLIILDYLLRNSITIILARKDILK